MNSRHGPMVELIQQFWHRFQKARLQQYRPNITEVSVDPITGRHIRLAPGRQKRHIETDTAFTPECERKEMKHGE